MRKKTSYASPVNPVDGMNGFSNTPNVYPKIHLPSYCIAKGATIR